MIKVRVVSFSPDQVGADGRVEEGEDGGESQLRSRSSCCQQAAQNHADVSVFQDITSRNE